MVNLSDTDAIRRCVNLDWLEVHVHEPIGEPHDAEYFRCRGFVVHERPYGTRVYRQMFTLYGRDGNPLLEVRRDPASQGLQGIHNAEESHIRLVNRSCYFDNAADIMTEFLQRYDYTNVRISRVDVCLDFTKFDDGDRPDAFVRRYFKHVYAKINQGNISSHGSDAWEGQNWNSLSWGAKTSDIGTKLYNKTLELYDAKTDSYKKPYIREAWLRSGLIDDLHRCTLRGNKIDVWRVEFSIRSSVKNWFVIEVNGKAKNWQSIRNTLEVYNSRPKMLAIFASLSQHYFHFKYYEKGQRKDRCRDKILFRWEPAQLCYKIGRDSTCLGDGKAYKANWDRLIAHLRLIQESGCGKSIYDACEVIIAFLERENLRGELANPWSHNELLTLQQALAQHIADPSADVAILLRSIKEMLSLSDRAAPF